ncbi:nucleotidyltransferase family protein [Camelimonas abortus]|uniref:Nucleotidyltransferase family protein n=1 Tax=Camelimonas abortus TaxID=1017184 RepID=A0ABV7LES1_9HYPH
MTTASPSAPAPITRAMVLAAGLGKRMRPITTTTPKPLVSVGGVALIDRLLDRLAEAGVTEAVVNVHYLADLVETHLERRRGAPRTVISDERGRLLETGGGVKKALPLLGGAPFFVGNSDSMWIEGPASNLRRMARFWDPERMDALLLLAATASSTGYDGPGDFAMDREGRLRRRMEREVTPFVYAGVAILRPELFAGAPEGPFSLNRIFDAAIGRGRLFGLRLDGHWLHVGTPGALRVAEDVIARSHR